MKHLPFSVETFVPPSDEGRIGAKAEMRKLVAAGAEFVSVTMANKPGGYQATLEQALSLCEEGIDVGVHMTASQVPVREVAGFLSSCHQAGVSRVLVLSGDGQRDEGYAPDALTLLRHIRDEDLWSNEIIVGAYPDRHPRSVSMEEDVRVLKQKVALGARTAITQMVYESEPVVRLQDSVPDIKIVPGIAPVVDWAGTIGFLKKCQSPLPTRLIAAVENRAPDEQASFVNAHLVEVYRRLRVKGLSEAHFYTLNKAEPTLDFWAKAG